MGDAHADVDRYIEERLLRAAQPGLAQALKRNAEAGLPAIDVSPAQGKFLHLLVKLTGARRVLEIGTLGGYSTIWMASALLPGGKLISLEFQLPHAQVARENIAKAGLDDLAEVRVGAALDLLPDLEGAEPFDFVFIDADKANNWPYVEWALKLTRPGAAILVDNVVRGGAVLGAASSDVNVQGVRRLFERVANEPRLDATALQTVGLKGWDGLMICVVK